MSYGVRVLRLLGCDTLFVTNAAGGVNWKFQAGDLMLITDHIKIFMESPLWGENIPEFGPRFPDASYLYTPRLQELARQQARRLDMDLKEGVYMYFPGPQYETPAEVRMARILGADAVGMSTAPEVITAGHCGMEVLGFTLVSNMAAGVLPKKLSEEEVLEAAAAARDRFSSLVLASSSTLTLDVLKGRVIRENDEKSQVLVMRGLIVLFIAISVVLAIIQYRSSVTFIAQLMGVSWGALAGAFLAPFLYSLYWKKATRGACWVCFLFSTIFMLANIFVGNRFPAILQSPINAGAFCMLAGLIIVPVVSLLTPKPDKNLVDAAFSCYDRKVLVRQRQALGERE